MSTLFDISSKGQTKTRDLNSACRLCLDDKDVTIQIFDFKQTKNITLSLADIIMISGSIKIEKDDGLPTMICKKCFNVVNRTFRFKERCKKTDFMLRKCLSEFNSMQQHNEKEDLYQPNTKIAVEKNTKQFVSIPENRAKNNCDLSSTTVTNIDNNFINTQSFQNDNANKQTAVLPSLSSALPYDKKFITNAFTDNIVSETCKNSVLPIHNNVNNNFTTVCKVPTNLIEDNSNTSVQKLDNFIGVINDNDQRVINSNIQENISNNIVNEILKLTDNGNIIVENYDNSNNDHRNKNNNNHHLDDDYSDLNSVAIVKNDVIFDNSSAVKEIKFVKNNNKKKNKLCNKGLNSRMKRLEYKCDLCLKVCKSHASFYYHKLIHTGTKPHECSYCSKRFYQKCTLIKHERTHTGERPYTCDKCGKSFIQECNLKFHLTSHSDEKVFCCHVCGKRFTLRHNLNEHLKIHNNRERMFPCNNCNKSFYHRSHLMSHIPLHASDKQFCCDICGKLFTKQSYLKLHNRTHTGEKPYECSLCTKTFASNSNLHAHTQTHNATSTQKIAANVAMYKCSICTKTFPSNSYLNVHIKTHNIGEKDSTKLSNECKLKKTNNTQKRTNSNLNLSQIINDDVKFKIPELKKNRINSENSLNTKISNMSTDTLKLLNPSGKLSDKIKTFFPVTNHDIKQEMKYYNKNLIVNNDNVKTELLLDQNKLSTVNVDTTYQYINNNVQSLVFLPENIIVKLHETCQPSSSNGNNLLVVL